MCISSGQHCKGDMCWHTSTKIIDACTHHLIDACQYSILGCHNSLLTSDPLKIKGRSEKITFHCTYIVAIHRVPPSVLSIQVEILMPLLSTTKLFLAPLPAKSLMILSYMMTT